ncbi:Na+/H+ antiporter [Marinactinospora rubrisoli]|uniref:Na+/H+ antiporter n=1 Tax=Marinactinospora rubrisoli TaxID=2715399 RepID=A0ABW2KBZ0_9ACTN
MTEDEYILAGLLVILVVLVGRLLAPRLRLPDAVVLVLLGFAVSFLPGMRGLHVSPEVVLLVFLPPLIYNAAFFSSPREMRAEARPIVTLAVGMTLMTAFAVAAVTFMLLPNTDWPAAIALGAAVAPTDAVAASAVLRRVGAPRRVVTILEGESLINDGVALTLFSLAITAMTAELTFGDSLLELVKVVLGGVAFGLVIAKLVMWSRGRLHDGNTQLVVSLVTPFVAYIPAELLGFSGVLSAVVAGFLLGTRGEGILPPRVRVTGRTVWQGLVMLLESILFVLLGLQLHEVLDEVVGRSMAELAVTSVAVIGTAVAFRLLWEVVVTPVARHLPDRLRLDPGPIRHRIIIGWSGMRGAISLAIALSLPLTIGDAPFADRNVLIFLAAGVVLATLVGQGMTLPLVLRRLRITQDSRARHEIALAEVAMGRAALTRIDELLADDQVDSLAAETYRQMYKLRVRQSRAMLEMTGGDRSALHHVKGTVFLKHELAAAQRAALSKLYRKGEISHEVYQALQRELDLQEPHRPR